MAAPVIGRDEEQHVIADTLRGRGSVVLAGTSGIGKTFLARQIVSGLAEFDVVWTSATRSSQGLPLSALAPLFAVQGLADVVRSSDDVIALAEAVQNVRVNGRLLLAVDDAHFLDDVSATLVHHVVTAAAIPVLLVITSGMPAPDAVVALWKDNWASRVELVALARFETGRLVEHLVDGPCSSMVHDEVWEATGGNPLFVCELVRAAVAGGALRIVESRWELMGPLAVGQRLSELVGTRIEALPLATRRAAEIVAVAEPAPLALIERIVEATALADAEERGIVSVDLDGERAMARIVHPLYAEVLRSRTAVARRRAIARQLADAHETAGLTANDDLLRFAGWRLDAEAPPPIEVLIDAAWIAAEAFDPRLAERFAQAAVNVPDTAPEPAHAARLVLADAQYRQGRHDDALWSLDGGATYDDATATEVAVFRASILLAAGRTPEAERVVESALSQVSEPSCVAWLRARRAWLLVADGELTRSIDLAEPVAVESFENGRATLTALSALAMAYALAGRRDKALAAVTTGRDPALRRGTDLRTLLSWVTPAVWIAHIAAGELEAADSVAQAFLELAVRARSMERIAAARLALAWGSLRRGDVTTAQTLLVETTTARASERWPTSTALVFAGMDALANGAAAYAAALAGDPSAAGRAARRVETASPAGPRWFDAWASVAGAWSTYAAGSDREARERFAAIAGDARRRGEAFVELEALYARARLGDVGEVVTRIGEVAALMDGAYAPLVAQHCRALHANNADALDGISSEFAALGYHVDAAEAAAAAAALHHDTREPARAEASRARVDRELAACPGARPRQLHGWRLRSALTARELDVARLAALGRPTRAIAEELFVSSRTVDTHLAHIYTKLAIAGRHELPAALGEHRG